MELRKLGTGGLEVGAMGLGCMGITHGYVRPEDIDEAEGIATINRALDRGLTLLDTAEAKREPARLLMVVLKSAPTAGAAAALRAAIPGRERIELVGRHLYAFYPDGMGVSKLALPLIEKRIGARGTGRNWNTVLKLDVFVRSLAA